MGSCYSSSPRFRRRATVRCGRHRRGHSDPYLPVASSRSSPSKPSIPNFSLAWPQGCRSVAPDQRATSEPTAFGLDVEVREPIPVIGLMQRNRECARGHESTNAPDNCVIPFHLRSHGARIARWHLAAKEKAADSAVWSASFVARLDVRAGSVIRVKLGIEIFDFIRL